MKAAAVLGTMLASVAFFAGPAAADKVPKAFQCVPIEGNSSPAYDQSCNVWLTNGEFADVCGCMEGFSLVDPRSSLLTIQGEDLSASPGKASGS